MKLVILGHRGTGKSAFLKRLKQYEIFKGRFVDLDSEIETITGYSVTEFFEKKGEAEFRQIELNLFKKITELSEEFIIAVGGGFPVKEIPPSVQVLWLRRESDQLGRIFVDRPRLLPGLHPLEEYEIKRAEREKKFLKRADKVYTAPEGITLNSRRALDIENLIISGRPFNCGGYKTLVADEKIENQSAAPDFFEIRDDLLNDEQAFSYFNKLSEDKILYSLRKKEKIASWALHSNCQIDVDFEKWKTFQQRVPVERLILSSHDQNINTAIENLSSVANVAHYKLCPQVDCWSDLIKGHQWQMQDSNKRSFLPRSTNGRWAWYRLYQKNKQKINFWRSAEGSSTDQPLLFNWLAMPHEFSKFAAVLGSPVSHSFSPLFHLDQFSKANMPFWSIDIQKEEWSEAFKFLESLGLAAAAVTSPLKVEAFKAAQAQTDICLKLQSANTLWKDSGKSWVAHNTDFAGFKSSLQKQNLEGPFVLWGGGGTLSMIQEVIPEVVAFSSRQAGPRDGMPIKAEPSTVIWGAPNHPDTKMPPLSWSPTWVLDLNYKENSLARYYAMQCGAHYISGLDFFCQQALEQQKFWGHYL